MRYFLFRVMKVVSAAIIVTAVIIVPIGVYGTVLNDVARILVTVLFMRCPSGE